MKKLCLVLFTVFNCLYSYGNGLDSLKNVLDSIAKANNVVGMEVSVIVNGDITWNHQYGYLKANNTDPVDSLTLFQCASISKPIAALGVLQLYEEGKLHLDSNVNKYLKGWQLKDNKFTRDSAVTVRMLLNHTGGLNHHGGDGYKQGPNLPELIDLLNGKGQNPKIKVKHIPGTEWHYSGGGYMVLRKVIEDISGLTFEEYMQENVLKPLDMNKSTFQHYRVKDSIPNISFGHWENGSMLKEGWHLNPDCAAAGLWSTSMDLSKYIIEIQEILNGKEGGVIKQETALEMLKQRKNKWGLGPYTRLENDGMWYFGHTGWTTGYKSIFDGSFDLSQGGFVIMFNNEVTMDAIHKMYAPIMDYYRW